MLYISAAVSRGDEWARKLVGLAPAYGFHFATGLLGLWLIMRAVA